jgi:Kef-type K+ transport system membrane component KefB
MGGASSYIAILAICGFLSAAWMATKVSKLLGVSSIVLEITTGVVLGPRMLGLISPEYATCEYITHVECELPSDFQERLDKGLPLGNDLGRIASMDYCDRATYLHHGEGHDEEGHGDNLAGGHASGHVGAHAGTGLDESPNGSESSGGHNNGDHGSGDHGSGSHRRLSGGGGDYASYEECLVKSCEADVAHHCGLTPDVFTLIGHTGVALMIFESGMHFDFDKAKVVGPWACVVAVLGTILPFITGSMLMLIYGYPLLPDAVSVGTALAPTSVGIALRLLGEAGVLQQDFGQAIITAAFVDDILSLILFNVLFSLQGDFDVMATVVNPIIGVAFMGIAIVLAVKFWPNAINKAILPKLPKKAGEAKVTSDDEGLFLIMMGLLVVYGTVTHFLGTHLWGCFIAGMSFACIDQEGQKGHTHHVWVRQTKRYTTWMIRIFFSCTVAFSIPISQLMSLDAFLKGSIMGIGPCILTKVLCAPFMGKAKFVIGWAMVGRAEFAYLIAQMAAAGGMIYESAFSISIWALLYATIFAPFVFRYVLNKYIRETGLERGAPVVENSDGDIVVDHPDGKLPKALQMLEEATTFGKSDPEKEKSAAPSEAPAVSTMQPKGWSLISCLCGPSLPVGR